MLVSHRFSTVPAADRIVVIEGGRVEAHGGRGDLMHEAGTYAELYRIQERAYRVRDTQSDGAGAGHVQSGETPAAAIARELNEELGVTVGPPAGPPWKTLSDDDAGITLAIWVVDHAGPVENRAPQEHDELRWVTAADLPDPAYEALFMEALDRS